MLYQLQGSLSQVTIKETTIVGISAKGSYRGKEITVSLPFTCRLFLLVQAFGGITVAEFSSRLPPNERRRTMKEFEQGKIQL